MRWPLARRPGLSLVMWACGIEAGDQVITVGNSDVLNTAAISLCWGRPVFCDFRLRHFTIDSYLVEACLTACTRSLLTEDLYGHPAEVRALRQFAERHRLKIIEYAGLSLGASGYGWPVGRLSTPRCLVPAPIRRWAEWATVVSSDPMIFRLLSDCSSIAAVDAQRESPFTFGLIGRK